MPSRGVRLVMVAVGGGRQHFRELGRVIAVRTVMVFDREVQRDPERTRRGGHPGCEDEGAENLLERRLHARIVPGVA